MKSKLRRLLKTKNKRGATIIMVALSLVIIVGVATFAVDIGYLLVARNQLQNIADSAALAATGKLGSIYTGMTLQQQQTYVCNPLNDGILAVTQNVAGDISINPSDVIVGQWNAVDHILTATLDQPDAVKVVARRDKSANGPITAFFANILGIKSFNVSAMAIAALTSATTVKPQDLGIPVGISKKRFESEFCNQPIKFSPTNDIESCGGWNVYEYPKNANNAVLTDIIKALEVQQSLVGTYIFSDTIVAGETQFAYIGGDLANVLFKDDLFPKLFDIMRVLNDGVLDKDNDSLTWTTTVTVYDKNDCSNPNSGDILKVLGFATATIKSIEKTGKIIQAEIDCNAFVNGRGGGTNNYGTKGSIPGLVK